MMICSACGRNILMADFDCDYGHVITFITVFPLFVFGGRTLLLSADPLNPLLPSHVYICINFVIYNNGTFRSSYRSILLVKEIDFVTFFKPTAITEGCEKLRHATVQLYLECMQVNQLLQVLTKACLTSQCFCLFVCTPVGKESVLFLDNASKYLLMDLYSHCIGACNRHMCRQVSICPIIMKRRKRRSRVFRLHGIDNSVPTCTAQEVKQTNLRTRNRRLKHRHGPQGMGLSIVRLDESHVCYLLPYELREEVPYEAQPLIVKEESLGYDEVEALAGEDAALLCAGRRTRIVRPVKVEELVGKAGSDSKVQNPVRRSEDRIKRQAKDGYPSSEERQPRCVNVLLDCFNHVGQVQLCYTWQNGAMFMERKCLDKNKFEMKMTKPPGRILKVAQQHVTGNEQHTAVIGKWRHSFASLWTACDSENSKEKRLRVGTSCRQHLSYGWSLLEVVTATNDSLAALTFVLLNVARPSTSRALEVRSRRQLLQVLKRRLSRSGSFLRRKAWKVT
ncbi:hypothetical protein M513_12278 [Trichuris suis]|uniref:Uncharacterized protein n=1 Tax=Trichuris suis TaxID=68888 RepID=A0A085LPD6_9BILA|nr:hypothetical protein M513_12278 [Trichuris suis]